MWLLDCRCLGWAGRFWLVVAFASCGSVGLRSFRDLTVGTLWCGCWIGLSCLGLVMISVCSVGGWVGFVGALCFWIGLLFVVVAADLVCECYSMVSSCVFRGCRLVGFVLRWFGLDLLCAPGCLDLSGWGLADFMASLAFGCSVVDG